MADPLGTIATILQLVQTVIDIRNHIEDFRNAPREQQKLLMEMDALCPLLEELKTRIAGHKADGIVKQMNGPLVLFKLTMQQFTEKFQPESGLFSEFSKRLRWTVRDKQEAKEYLVKFEQFKSLLNSWLLINLWDIAQQHRQDDSAMLLAAERTEIIDWLCPINFFLRHADISRVRQEGTGLWLLSHPGFQEWKSGWRRTLWCRGIPGSGKTVLASMVVDHLRAEYEKQSIGVASIYLDHKEAENQSPAKLLFGLWRQLVIGKDVGSLAERVYRQHRERGTTPTLNEVSEVLRFGIEKYSKVFLIVDAIDEYPEVPRRILVRHLSRSGSTVYMMVTSRHNITPDTSFPSLEILDIRAMQEDIREYVDAQIDLSPRLSMHVQKYPSLRDDIHTKISSRTVDGMFLLAKLHIESLSTKSTTKAVREALNNLPKQLNDSYDIAMQRIEAQDEEDRRAARSALIWVSNAKRPLTAAELRTALAIEPGARRLDEENLMDIEIILAVCAGLIILDEHLNVVRLVHYTTQEYLDSIQAEQFPDAQTEITRTLLTFLSFDDFASSFWGNSARHPHLPINPLALHHYSQYCLIHARGQPEVQLRSMITEFLGRAHELRETMKSTWSSPPWNGIWPIQPSALWISARANLVETAKFLLETSQLLLEDSNGSALNVASYYGHVEMVQLLLEYTADVNSSRGPHGSALGAAVHSGNANVVQLLIDGGADIDKLVEGHGTVLATASFLGYENLVRLLIANGADVNARDATDTTALGRAVAGNHEHIVRFLLENGANDSTALEFALFHCEDDNIARLLLENGTDVTGVQILGSALVTAAYGGRENLVQLLIENGADLDASRGEYGTALATASFCGYENIVRLLLENGANVNARGGRYDFALHAASANGQEDIVRLLMENGADANMSVPVYGTVLAYAAYHGRESLVRLLLENGVEVNAQASIASRYNVALHAAVSSGNENIAQLLIKNGADVNLHFKFYGSALVAASYFGQNTLVHLLMNNGADVNRHVKSHGTALAAASYQGHEQVVELLIGKGADPNAEGGEYGPALVAASRAGHQKIVQLLLDNGADVNVQDKRYGSASQAASQRKHGNIVTLLIQYGAKRTTMLPWE
ncbi:ankyrin repeat-containing domain protein [Mycena galopus ATCC 62051]|nr:ankyrin repeat-containing domain protein [Mycena galopus ATCC 62051]